MVEKVALMLTEKIRLFCLRDLLEREGKKVNWKQLVKKLPKWWEYLSC